MPIFEPDSGRSRLVQPMQPLAGTFLGEVRELLSEHLAAVVGEPMFVVRARSVLPEHVDAPELLAIDAVGRPVVLEVAQVVDDTVIVRALRHIGAAGRLTPADMARVYHTDTKRFAIDYAAFCDQVPFVRPVQMRLGIRLIIMCAEVAAESVDPLAAVRAPGWPVMILQVGVVRGEDGRRLLDVSPLAEFEATRRSVEPPALRLVQDAPGAVAVAPGGVRPPTPVPGGAVRPPMPASALAPLAPARPPFSPARPPVAPAAVAPARPEMSPVRPETPSIDPRVAPARPAASPSRSLLTPASLAPPPPAPLRPEAPAARPGVSAARAEAPAAYPQAPAFRPEAPAFRPEAPAAYPQAPAFRPVGPPSASIASSLAALAFAAERDEPKPAPLPAKTPPSAERGFGFVVRGGPLPELAQLAERYAPVPLVWVRARRGQRIEATLRRDGLIQLADGSLFADPDLAAARAAHSLGQADGWGAWRLGDSGPTLAEVTQHQSWSVAAPRS